MTTIKLIDLFVKIANEEELPKKIKYQNHIYIYDEDAERYYINGNSDNYSLFSEFSYLDLTALIDFLNDEVEIIEDTPKEDKKIEKFKVIKDNAEDSVELVYDGMRLNLTLLQAIILDKINEIIDYLKSKGE